MAKDLFSGQANLYAQYRPTYPDELIEYILSFVPERKSAWDCATGNGQAAVKLAAYFQKVHATDISEAQLRNAVPKENITYQESPAESTPFSDNTFDLITVAQAYHWINWNAFHTEATRVAKNNAVIAIWAYGSLTCNDTEVNGLFDHFYKDVTQPYWDYERRYVDERYETVEFHFDTLPSRPFQIRLHWTRDQFKGYLESWSAVQKYIRVNHESPLSLIEEALEAVWPQGRIHEVLFPIYLRIGQIRK